MKRRMGAYCAPALEDQPRPAYSADRLAMIGWLEQCAMDFKDISARMKQQRGDEPEAQPLDIEESYRIRGRMVGVLLRDARLSVGRSVEDCARLLRVAPEQIEAWEFGDSVPTLPQLEILAYFLDVPVSHFWGSNTLESNDAKAVDTQAEYMALRDRMIGAMLRQAREALTMTLDDLAAATGIPSARINQYELGEIELPMHELTVLSAGVKKNMDYFLETSSHIGELLALREEWKHFADLPDEIRQFAANPLNVGFIEIAIMLSEMPTDRLRRVGESVLNITL
jgi:transcriptional regulator with XRE-family HTH domain